MLQLVKQRERIGVLTTTYRYRNFIIRKEVDLLSKSSANTIYTITNDRTKFLSITYDGNIAIVNVDFFITSNKEEIKALSEELLDATYLIDELKKLN